MDLDCFPTFLDAAGDATAAAPNATTTDVKPAKKYANKTVCWKKMFPDATETWAEVCNNKDDERVKSFHLDTYCFDSGSENWLFWDLLREQRVKKIYFTGMLTHGQSDFFIQYIDPDSRTVRSYYPDFIFQREEPDGSLKYVIVEVKADNQIEDAVVQAKKDFAQQIAVASGMEYRIMKSTDADKRNFRMLL